MLKPPNSPPVAGKEKVATTDTLAGCFERLKMLSVPVTVAVMLFAMSTWISIVGIWVEMPLLVRQLPESWNLPSYLVIIIQCANLGPAVYTIIDRMKAKDKKKLVQPVSFAVDVEVIVTLIVIVMAAVSVLLMSFLWSVQVEVGGTQCSLALLVLVCFAALSSCTSSVVFLPFMARFPSIYISAYYFGQGLCGLIPGIAGLMQGAGKEPDCINITEDYTEFNETMFHNSSRMKIEYHPPRFSVSAFFGFITVLLCVSAASFCCLNFMKCCRVIRVSDTGNNKQVIAEDAVADAGEDKTSNPNENVGVIEKQEGSSLLHSDQDKSSNIDQNNIVVELVSRHEAKNKYRTTTMLIIVGVVSALWNGILPATQSYTCLPYGSLAYTLSICLSWIVSPLATFPNMVAPTSSLKLVGSVTMCAVVLSAFHLVLASMSPHPILQGTATGQFIVVSTSVVIAFSFSFVRVSVASMLRREGGRSDLLWCGGITQFGSFCGAIVSFILVSVVKVFQRMPQCG